MEQAVIKEVSKKIEKKYKEVKPKNFTWADNKEIVNQLKIYKERNFKEVIN